MKPHEPQTAKCRFCNAEYGFTEADKHLLLPFMCWKCTEAANQRWEQIQADRKREQIPFSPLGR